MNTPTPTHNSPEEFATVPTWSKGDTIAVLTLATFIAGLAVQFFVITSDTFMTLYHFLLPAALSVLLITGYGPLLAQHWRSFRPNLGKNIPQILLLVASIHLALYLIRLPFGDIFTAGPLKAHAQAIEATHAHGPLLLLALLASFGPMLVAFVEDTIFRHTLLARIPVWGRGPLLPAFLIILNSFAFGALHIWAFGGSLLATVPYMVIGLIMNLIYLWKRNLWFVLGTHIIFNSLPFLSTLLIIPLRLLGAL